MVCKAAGSSCRTCTLAQLWPYFMHASSRTWDKMSWFTERGVLASS